MLKEAKENCANENTSNYFSFFNHKLFESPLDYQEYPEYHQKEYLSNENTYSQSLEGSSTNSSNESFNSLDNEEKLIPLNLLDISPIKILNNSPKTKISSPTKTIIKTEQKAENKNKSKNKEIQPELRKYLLPKSLFNTNKNKNNDIKNKILGFNSFAPFIDNNNNLNLYNQLYTAKYGDYYHFINNNDGFCFLNNIGDKLESSTTNYKLSNNKNNMKNMNNKNNKKKKKKQEFVEREGDWPCYRCKNINFSFREKCNKCLFSKDESEKKFQEAGEALIKLADILN